MWRKFVGVIGRPELAKDNRFTGTGHRLKYRDALTAEINRALAAHPAQYWIDLLNREGIPAGPILTIEEMFNHPQTAAREMLLQAAASRDRHLPDDRPGSEAIGDSRSRDAASTIGRAHGGGAARERLHRGGDREIEEAKAVK